jgi:hypothetical protein
MVERKKNTSSPDIDFSTTSTWKKKKCLCYMVGRTMIQVEFVPIDIGCCCQCSGPVISEVEKEWGSSGQHRCGFQYPICQKMESVYAYHSSTMTIVHTGSNAVPFRGTKNRNTFMSNQRNKTWNASSLPIFTVTCRVPDQVSGTHGIYVG